MFGVFQVHPIKDRDAVNTTKARNNLSSVSNNLADKINLVKRDIFNDK